MERARISRTIYIGGRKGPYKHLRPGPVSASKDAITGIFAYHEHQWSPPYDTIMQYLKTLSTKEIEGSPPVAHHSNTRITRVDHQRFSPCIIFRRLLTASGSDVLMLLIFKRCDRHVWAFSNMVGGLEGFTFLPLLWGLGQKGQLGPPRPVAWGMPPAAV